MRWSCLLLVALAACNDSAPAAGGDGSGGTPDLTEIPDLRTTTDSALAMERPYKTKIPAGYDKNTPTPLVILLHGYGADGATQDALFGLSGIVDQKGFLYAYPDGTRDSLTRRFWNATDACCDIFHTGIDDVAYVDAIIDDMARKYNVDWRRIYLVGHSNGAFMSHRFACDEAPRVAAIISLAGAVWKDPTKCQPKAPVSVLQVHGTADLTISYNGGYPSGLGVTGLAQHPGARETVATWAAKNGCTGTLAPTGQKLDIDRVLSGDETTVETYGGCKDVSVELWTIQNGGHIPSLTSSWASMVIDWFYAHPKK